MSKKQETIADIVAEMRIFKCHNLETGRLEECSAIAKYLANRIEAAYRVETLRWVEANAGLAKLIDPEKMLTGNGAKMREVVELLARVILPPQEEYPAEYGGGKVPDKDGWLAWIRQVQSYAKSALAEPLRNCDVGTAMEQGERFSAYCRSHKHPESECLHCPLFGQTGGYCELAWAQMPYEPKAEISKEGKIND